LYQKRPKVIQTLEILVL